MTATFKPLTSFKSYRVTISKGGKSRPFGFNKKSDADRFEVKMKKEGFETSRDERDTLELLKAMFPEKFVA